MVAPSPSRVGAAARTFLGLLPALLVALLCLRAAELFVAMPPGLMPSGVALIVVRTLSGDLYALVRLLPLLLLYSLPPLLLANSRRVLHWSLGLGWSALVCLQAALAQYYVIARVPLGSDLYAYSRRDIGETLDAGLRLHPVLIAGTLVALLSLWLLLALLARRERMPLSPRAAATLYALSLVMLVGPSQLPQARSEGADAYDLRINKSVYFLAESATYLVDSAGRTAVARVATGNARPPGPSAPARYLDPRYPFLHAEQTVDMLGEHFLVHRESPPNLVFIIVEGLGRAFSGPNASLGSFTPFLDQLAKRSLYWENFLATQGRTFSVLPSIFGSLPYGETGFSALGTKMPAHVTLLSVLKDQGYHLSFYAGTNLEFDGERDFLRRQGVDVLRERRDFGPRYTIANDWGYADDDVVSLALADEASVAREPFVSVLQTNTSHSPYTFPGQPRYLHRFEQRLDELGVTESRKREYRAYQDMYASILYVDDALRRYLEAMSKRPTYANTIFIITGDHRLPEIPLEDWIDRYHVPLIVFSPLLKAPLRIRSVSSQFDIAPSVLAFLAHGYGVRTPARVTWIGSGLDLAPMFRSVHQFPMKQTKTDLVDFVDGPWLLSRERLYALSDGLHPEPAVNKSVEAAVAARFAAFRWANAQFARTLALAPTGTFQQLSAYDERVRVPLPAAAPTAMAVLGVTALEIPDQARAGHLGIGVTFANADPAQRAQFMPLVVLQSATGAEISETYGSVVTLDAGRTVTLHLQVRSDGLAAGRYFMSVLPADPATGKRQGVGRYHIPIVIED